MLINAALASVDQSTATKEMLKRLNDQGGVVVAQYTATATTSTMQ
jgi:hypothetical protein